MNGIVDRENNKIQVIGDFMDARRLLSLMHVAIEKAGYHSIVLDLSNCTKTSHSSMPSVCAQVMAYRNTDVEFTLIPPDMKILQNLFVNTNWAYFIDPYRFDHSTFKGHTKIPVTQYRTSDDQQDAVNRIVDVILSAVPHMEREDFAAFEWSVNELTDNVLVHSQSPIGGLIQVSTFERTRNQVQFVVADAGVGIPSTLKEGHPDVRSDTSALDMAIREGVTRDKKLGQGNGLFGSYQICSRSNGYFSVYSGHAHLEYKSRKGLSIVNESIPYDGTCIVATIDFSEPNLLGEALRFKGNKYSPVDYVETRYEANDDEKIIFKLKEHSASFGSRVSGKPIRTKLSNILRMTQDRKVCIDFEGIPLISSSFADEAFAKLFLEAGAVEFMQKFEFINAMETIKHLINKAINQRVSTGVVD